MERLGKLRRSEVIGGILYWPCFLFLTGAVVARIMLWCGLDLTQSGAALKVNTAVYLVNLVAVALIFYSYHLEQLGRVRTNPGGCLKALAIGLVLYYALTILADYIITAAAGLLQIEMYNANNEAVVKMTGMNRGLMAVLTVLIAPFVEETLCRGVVFCGLYRRSRVLAYALSMLVFSGIHVYAGALNQQPVAITVLCMLQYLPAGFVLARVYESSGTVWTAITLHGCVNLIALLLN